MKTLGLFALSGAALLQGDSAACCRSNKCLKANIGTVTVTSTAAATTFTETVTTTLDQVTEFTSTTLDLFTETTTETASTETLFYTETVTSTGPVETDTVTRTLTQILTATSTELAPGVTSTATSYLPEPTVLKAKARRTAGAAPSALPEYASADCADWAKYIKACKCAGVELTTVTATVSPAAETETVTVTIPGEEVTVTVPMTVSSTQTAIVSATATDATTVTETVTEMPDGVTATSTTTAIITSTPTTVVSLTCQPTGHNFQVSTPNLARPIYGMWLYADHSGQVFWPDYPVAYNAPPPNLNAVWSVDNNGDIQARGFDGVLYVPVGSSAASLPVKVGSRATVDAGVTAGTMARIKGCIDDTGRSTVSGNGRQNLVHCGESGSAGAYISSGNGADLNKGCVQATPTAVKAYM